MPPLRREHKQGHASVNAAPKMPAPGLPEMHVPQARVICIEKKLGIVAKQKHEANNKKLGTQRWHATCLVSRRQHENCGFRIQLS